MEHLQSAIKAQSIADPILKITAIIRQLGYAAYLVNDHLSWVSLNFAKSKACDLCQPFKNKIQMTGFHSHRQPQYHI